MTAENKILRQADKLINNARYRSYGAPLDNFTDIATMLNVVLRKKLKADLIAEDIPGIMIAIKQCRQANAHNDDNMVDIAGYAGTFGMVNEDRLRRKVKGKRKQQKPKPAATKRATPALDPLPGLKL